MRNTDLALETLVLAIADAGSRRGINGFGMEPVVLKLLKEVKKKIKENQSFYRSIVEEVNIHKIQGILSTCLSEGGDMNWGRFVAIFALLYVYAEKNKECSKCLSVLRSIFTEFLQKEVGPWIKTHGGIYEYACEYHYRFWIGFYIMTGIIAIVLVKKVFQ